MSERVGLKKSYSEINEIESKVRKSNSESKKIDTEIVLIKIDGLKDLLESINIDEERNGVLGSDIIFQNAFNPSERSKIKAKIFKLIEEL